MAIECRQETMHYSVTLNFYLLWVGRWGVMYVHFVSFVAHRHIQCSLMHKQQHKIQLYVWFSLSSCDQTQWIGELMTRTHIKLVKMYLILEKLTAKILHTCWLLFAFESSSILNAWSCPGLWIPGQITDSSQHLWRYPLSRWLPWVKCKCSGIHMYNLCRHTALWCC